jgi:hypothetical protein
LRSAPYVSALRNTNSSAGSTALPQGDSANEAPVTADEGSSRPLKRASELSGDAPANKAPRTGNTEVASRSSTAQDDMQPVKRHDAMAQAVRSCEPHNAETRETAVADDDNAPVNRVIRFIPDLLHCAARCGKLGREVTDENSKQWKRQCVEALADGVDLNFVVWCSETFPSCFYEAASTVETIYELATESFATEEDLAYVLEGSSQSGDDASRWDITATRMVEVCALWRIRTHVSDGFVDPRARAFLAENKYLMASFKTKLSLFASCMPTELRRAEEYPELIAGGAYHGLSFAATHSSTPHSSNAQVRPFQRGAA